MTAAEQAAFRDLLARLKRAEAVARAHHAARVKAEERRRKAVDQAAYLHGVLLAREWAA
jgi:hypothetical protein